MSWFKGSTYRRKASFLKETVENADLRKAVLNKTMTTQENSVKYDFVAALRPYKIRKFPRSVDFHIFYQLRRLQVYCNGLKLWISNINIFIDRWGRIK